MAAAFSTAACSPAIDEHFEQVGSTSEAIIACSNASLFTPGDFNGDGKTDLIITNPTGSYWYLSDGNGLWTANTYMRSTLTNENTTYVVADFNGDGKDDMIITVGGNELYLYISNGNGQFTPNVWTATVGQMGASNAGVVAVGDFNGDGRKDVILDDGTAQRVYLSQFSGTSGQWDTSWGVAPGSMTGDTITTGNFDGAANRYDDIIVTGQGGSTVYYSAGTGPGWVPGLTRNDLTNRIAHYTVGDFNGDRNDDLVISTTSGSYWYFSNGTNHVWTENAFVDASLTFTGDFWGGQSQTAQQVFAGPSWPVVFNPLDLNDDGKTDLVIQTVTGSYAWVSTSTATAGSFQKPWALGSFQYFVPGDFNGDGASDLLFENENGTNVYSSTVTYYPYTVVPNSVVIASPTATSSTSWSNLAANAFESVNVPYPFWNENLPPPGTREPACFGEWMGPCPPSGSCGAGLTCVQNPYPPGETPICQSTCTGAAGGCCLPDSSCASGLTCQSGKCEPPPCSGAEGSACCTSGAPCASGLTCQSGACYPPCSGAYKSHCCLPNNTCASGLICAGNGECLQACATVTVTSCWDMELNPYDPDVGPFTACAATAAQAIAAVTSEANSAVAPDYVGTNPAPAPGYCYGQVTESAE